MADLQKYYREFQDKIRLGYGDKPVLLEKRDTVRRDLRIGLRKMFGAKYLKFTHFSQGSYALGTDVYPLDSDYDINIGIILQVSHIELTPISYLPAIQTLLFKFHKSFCVNTL